DFVELVEIDQLVARADDGDPRPSESFDFLDSSRGENPDHRRLEWGAALCQHIAALKVLTRRTNVLPDVTGIPDFHLIGAAVGVLLSNNRIGAFGDRRARHYSHRFPSLER